MINFRSLIVRVLSYISILIILLVGTHVKAQSGEDIFSVGLYSLERGENYYGEPTGFSFCAFLNLTYPEDLKTINLTDPTGRVFTPSIEPFDGNDIQFCIDYDLNPPPIGNYIITVINSSGLSESVTVPTTDSSLSSITPEIITPIDSSIITDPTPVLSWEPFESPEKGDDETLSYLLEIFPLDFSLPINDDVVWRASVSDEVLSAVYNFDGSAYEGFETLPPGDYSFILFAFEDSGNYRRTSFRISDFTVAKSINIDIHAGDGPNSINCKVDNMVVSVAILTTETFDATTIDHTTVNFEGATETHLNNKTGEPIRHEEDVDEDGDIDLLFHFRLGDTNLTCGSSEGTIIGETFEGLPVKGTDSIQMVGGPKLFATGLWGPFGMVFDEQGNLFVANEGSGGGGNTISQITSSGEVSTFASGFAGPAGVAFNSNDILYVSDDTNRVFSVSQTGELNVVVDQSIGLDNPNAIAFDEQNNLYTVSCGGFVSWFDPDGVLIDLALVDGFECPQSIVVDDNTSVLYVSDTQGNIFQIDKLTGYTELLVETHAFTEGGLALDEGGNIYFSAYDDGLVLLVNPSDLSVSTCLSGITTPRGLAFDKTGKLYVTSYETGQIFQANQCEK